MSEEQTTTTEDGGQVSQPEPTFTQAELEAQLKVRVERERAKYADYETLQAAAAELEELKAAELSEIERLQADAAKLKTENEANAAFKEAYLTALTRRIEAIPEEMQKRVPDFDDPRKTMQWLDDNSDMFITQKPSAPKIDATAQTGQGVGKESIDNMSEEKINALRKNWGR